MYFLEKFIFVLLFTYVDYCHPNKVAYSCIHLFHKRWILYSIYLKQET